jgi:hypothetical protein
MIKKVIGIFLILTLLISLCSCGGSTSSSAGESLIDTSSVQGKIDNSVLQYPATNDTFRYNVYTHYITISQCLSAEPNIAIPDTIDQLPVLVIEANAFNACQTLKSLTIGQNVANIGDYAFTQCANLETVVMPASLLSIGNSAFSGCVALKSITIPKNVATIPSNCFYGCSNLKSVTIEGGKEAGGNTSSLSTQEAGRSISSSAFANCPALSYAWIPDDVITIDQGAFYNSTEVLTIYGYSASQAAVYSANNLIDFVVLDKSQFTDMINSSFNSYPGVTESIQTNNIKVTLNKVTKSTQIASKKAAANNVFVIFDFTVENLSDTPVYFNSLFVTGSSGGVTKYPVYFANGAYTQHILAGTVTKSAPLTGYVAFEVNENYSHVLIDFNDVANFNTVDSIMVAYCT